MARTVGWKPRKENDLIGKEIPRIDGVEKASGHAKYAADWNSKGTLIGKFLTCKHAHAKIKKLDVSAAEKIKGVHAIEMALKEGDEIHWDGTIVAAVAAERSDIADDAIRAIVVQYEVLAHFVAEHDIEGAKALDAEHVDDEGNIKEASAAQGHIPRVKPIGKKNEKGDLPKALGEAKVVHKGHYGINTITHMCMETHGCHTEWTSDGSLDVHHSTQFVSGTAAGFAKALGLDAAQVKITCDYIGGGFGSKFSADQWDILCAKLSRKAKRPVRLLLDRATEMKIAGNRPSGYANVTIAADAEGKITGWDSDHWGTDGLGGSTISVTQIPYVFDIDHRHRAASGIRTNCGPKKAWRAPNHPQLCAITDTAIDDLAAKLGMNSYDVFMKNLDLTASIGRPDVYAEEMKIGAKLIDWQAKWHPHGKGGGNGSVKRGLGMALHRWGGGAHPASCKIRIHPDGGVESLQGSQDLGTGTRTIVAITVAETFGLKVEDVTVRMGSNQYPFARGSGGSTTVGGVSGPNRRAALEALWKLQDLVAAKYKVDAESLKAKGGKFWSDGKEVCTWNQACSLIGGMALEFEGKGPNTKDGLTSVTVGGIQMADVSVDTETGIIRINKLVAVQDCGLILDELTAKSQVLGGLIMGLAYALSEERIMDDKTGRFINADLENYKLPRIGDIGELVAEMYQPDSEYDRGVVGLGEPPVISTGACIANAVANATGVRVPVLPLTPQRVLEALKGGAA